MVSVGQSRDEPTDSPLGAAHHGAPPPTGPRPVVEGKLTVSGPCSGHGTRREAAVAPSMSPSDTARPARVDHPLLGALAAMGQTLRDNVSSPVLQAG